MGNAAASHAPNVILLAVIFIAIGIVIGLALAAMLFQLREAPAPSEDQKLRHLHNRLVQQIAAQNLRKAERRTSQRSPALFALDGVPAAERTGKSHPIVPMPSPGRSDSSRGFARHPSGGGYQPAADTLDPNDAPGMKRIGKSAKPSWPPQASLDDLPPDGGLVPLPELPGVKR